VFPAVPAEWKQASFSHLRTQGAFLVSATRENGQLRSVEVVAEKGGRITLRNTFPNGEFQSGTPAFTAENGMIEFTLQPGEKVSLVSK
jgi:alpha-L-fucosidase 2